MREPLMRNTDEARVQTATPARIARIRAADAPTGSAGEPGLLRLQRLYGNRAVQRIVLARKGAGAFDASPDVEAGIQRARGGGQALDAAVRRQMEPAMGADFSGVRVHADRNADSLNEAVSARAFTVGQDIFFRQGEYQPGSSAGRELLAHELTHVAQQGAAAEMPQAKLTVGAAGDQYEQEADRTASHVMRMEAQGIQRQPADDKEELQGKFTQPDVQRQATPDEDKEKEKGMPGVQRQIDEEDKKKKH